MGAGLRMAEEGADLIRSFRRQDMLELAGLLFNFRFAIHGQTIGEKALCQTMPADDATCTLAAALRKFDDHCAVAC